MSQRVLDMWAESELADFLDKHLYWELLKQKCFTSFKRVKDKKTQLKGIDVIGKIGHSTVNIDEKAQLHYINSPLPTFAFELSFVWNGDVVNGWFLNDSLLTDRYLLLWINEASTADLKTIKSEDLTDVEGMMVSKEALKTYLSDLGFNARVLQEKAAELRGKGVPGSHPTKIEGISYYLSPSSKYIEAPVNLVIKKHHLLKVDHTKRYKITQNGSERI